VSASSRRGGGNAEHSAEAVEGLRIAAEAGIHRLAIPTPFQVGRVNAYLIEDEPLTLIDSGPNSAKALDELELALGAQGHTIEEIGLLIISHQHIDHLGLAAVLERRSGAEVAALSGLDRYLGNFREEAVRDDRFAEQMMLRHGIPREIVTALRSVSASFHAWGSAVEVTRALDDGERIELRDRTLTVLHRPGHSPSDTVFFDESRRLLFAGDHLIARISSNPLIARPLESSSEHEDVRPRALLTYISSLKRTRAMDLQLVLPGHGEPILDHVAVIDERMRLHSRRAEKIRAMIADQPRTAHEIAQQMWGNVAVTQAYLTLSEVLGHLDLLLSEGRATEEQRDGVSLFRAV
jgi:glyoxylase-like metal-dependent hydrolase (beta-lactamase superfamily II)